MGSYWGRDVLAGLVAAAVLVLAAYSGASQALGAHPFWAVQIVWIGVGLGMVLFGLSRFWRVRQLVKLGVAVICLGLSWGVTSVGKTRFAASYAEDFVAGRMWYLGWIAFAAFAFAVLALPMARRR